MGGVKERQHGIWFTSHYHNPVHYVCPAGPPRPEQLPAGLASCQSDTRGDGCRSTKSRVWGRKHKHRTKLRAAWLFEWTASCGLFGGGESGWVSELLYHIHLLNVKTWLFGLFHTSWPSVYHITRNDVCCCRQLHPTVLAWWLFNPSNSLFTTVWQRLWRN